MEIAEAKKMLEEAEKADKEKQKAVEEAIQKLLDDAGLIMLPRFHGDVHDGQYSVQMGFVLMKKEEVQPKEA